MTEKMSAADALASIDDAVWFIGMALGENSSGAARLSQARATFAALIEENKALRSALGEVIDVAEGYMSFDEDSRFGIAIAQANDAFALSKPTP